MADDLNLFMTTNTTFTNLHKTLQELWTQRCGNPYGGGLLFNLISYQTHDAPTPPIIDLLKTTIPQFFPCRLIEIRETKEKQGEVILSADVRSNRGIFSEILSLDIPQQHTTETTLYLLPLLITDLPLIILWNDDPTLNHPLLNTLIPFTQRLLFIPRPHPSLADFSSRLLGLLQKHTFDAIDLSWLKISGWREALAKALDTPEHLECFQGHASLQLTYAGEPHNQNDAIPCTYLHHWIASRLRWKISENNALSFSTYHKQDYSYQVSSLAQLKSHEEKGSILQMKIEESNHHRMTLSLTGQDQITVNIETPFQCELPFILRFPSLLSGKGRLQEMLYGKMSPQYLEVLQLLAQNRWENS